MQISVWPDSVAGNGKDIYEKISQAMQLTDTVVDRRLSGDAGFIWSVLWFGRMSRNKAVWDHFRSQGKPVIVAEVGGISRDTTWRLSANGITRSAIFPAIAQDPSRPAKLGLTLKPWHKGDYVLICGQHGKSQQWTNMPAMGDYFKQTVLEVRKYTNRPIVIRSHPRYREGLFFNVDEEFYAQHKVEWNVPKIVSNTYDDFDLDKILAHAHCVISHSSNAGIAAVLSGTPAIVSSESLAYGMGGALHEIEQLPTPDRNDWLVDLAHKEWLAEELPLAWNS